MPETILKAIASCKSAHNDKTSSLAYESILNATGNNHAGTYGHSVLRLIEELGVVLEEGHPWPCFTALEALIDLYGSFEPDCATNEKELLSHALRKRVSEFAPVIAAISSRQGTARGSAAELLELIHGVSDRADR